MSTTEALSPDRRAEVYFRPEARGLFLFSFNMCWAGLNEYPLKDDSLEAGRKQRVQQFLRDVASGPARTQPDEEISIDLLGAHDGALLLREKSATGNSGALVATQRRLGRQLGRLMRGAFGTHSQVRGVRFLDEQVERLRQSGSGPLADALTDMRRKWGWDADPKTPRLLDFVWQEIALVYEREATDAQPGDAGIPVFMLIRVPAYWLRRRTPSRPWPLEQLIGDLLNDEVCAKHVRRVYLNRSAFNLNLEMRCGSYLEVDEALVAARKAITKGSLEGCVAECCSLIAAPTEPGWPPRPQYAIGPAGGAVPPSLDVCLLLKVDPKIEESVVHDCIIELAEASGLARARVCTDSRTHGRLMRQRYYLSGWQGYYDQAAVLFSCEDVGPWMQFSFAVNNLVPWVRDATTQLWFDKHGDLAQAVCACDGGPL